MTRSHKRPLTEKKHMQIVDEQTVYEMVTKTVKILVDGDEQYQDDDQDRR